MKKTTIHLVGALALASAFAASAQTTSAAPWYPSKFGAKDEIGAANYLTPAIALQAARLVKTGKVYSLGITVSTTTPVGFSAAISIDSDTPVRGGWNFGASGSTGAEENSALVAAV